VPLLTREALLTRQQEIRAAAELSRLRDRLRGHLDPLLDRPLFVPDRKPALTQDGGICAEDASRLEFDPLFPKRHRCPQCGRTYDGERHDWAWIWRYHLWLSERAIHLSLFAEEAQLVTRAGEILEAYTQLYPTLPNLDNVLGPTRLFFSTYLESIWLTQIIVAGSLLQEQAGLRADLAPMVRASADLIRSFDEGWSNRQVWNNLALASAGLWLGDDDLVHRAVDGPHGFRLQLRQCVTEDGLWFEGENYHFFALRGFLLGAEVVRAVGLDLYDDPRSGRKLRSMFLAPLDTVLPDLTLPARGDSPFGVSLRQERFAELWEVARARFREARIERVLTGLYADDLPERADPGFREIAEQEINREPGRIRRDRLGWKALLWMRPDPPNDDGVWDGGSRCLPGAGLVVLKPGEGRYVGLECGGAPGGHGHPDLLHLTLYSDGLCLGDPGTGSYVDATLAWYRSTRAHNAPSLADGDQLVRHGWCAAFDGKGGWWWCRGVAEDLFGDGTQATRTILAGPDFAVDLLEVEVPTHVSVDLPVHPLGGLPVEVTSPLPVRFDDLPRRFRMHPAGLAELILVDRHGEELFGASASGPPTRQFAPGSALPYLVRRAAGPGRWVHVYVYRGTKVLSARDDGGPLRVEMTDGTTVDLQVSAEAAIVARSGHEAIALGGVRPRPRFRSPPGTRSVPPVRCPVLPRLPQPLTWRAMFPPDVVHTLGMAQYRRSEADGPGEFNAVGAVFVVGTSLCFAVDVSKAECCFRPHDAPDPRWDNEHPDIHSDGIECFHDVGGWAGYLVVPDTRSDTVRVRAVAGTVGQPSRVRGTWSKTSTGYAVVVAIEIGHRLRQGDTFRVNLVVNEMYSYRQRRAGQLALSGGGGWVYLRGDREAWQGAANAEVT